MFNKKRALLTILNRGRKLQIALFLFSLFFHQNLYAACGGTVRTWSTTAAAVTWATANSWIQANVPDTAAEDVVVQASTFAPNISSNATVGCVDVVSGTLSGTTLARTLTVTGDHFTQLAGTLNITATTNTILMSSAAIQTFEAINNVRNLSINTSTSVTLKNTFNILATLTLAGTGTTYIEGTTTVTNAITIPAGHTLVIKSGATLTSTNNLTVNGTLTIQPGGELKMLSTRVLSVPGTLNLSGSVGNLAKISSSTPTTFFVFNVAGTITANYFAITRTSTGMNATGTISQLDNGEFHGIVTAQHAIVLGAATVLPATMTGLKFYNDDNVAAPLNINATGVTGSGTTINNYAGSISGATYETDPSSKIAWGSLTTTGGCGNNNRTWAGSTVTWATTTNWSGTNVPDTADENVIIVNNGVSPNISSKHVVGCVDVQSGVLAGTTANMALTVVGDYFQAPFQNTLNFTVATHAIIMAGSTPQTFEAVDSIRDLRIQNPTSVTLKNSFSILSDLVMVGAGTTYIEGDITLTNALTIPAGHTLIIKNGGALLSSNNLTVNGTLKVEAGGELRMANTRVLNIASAGVLQLAGASGNPARLVSANASSWFTFTMAGTITANYFVIQRTLAAGLNVTGTIGQLDNGEFRGIPNLGYGMTWGAAAVVPATLDGLGFYNDDAVATPRNINASVYNLSGVTITNYSGSVSGAAFENDTNSKITWTGAAATELSITNDAEANEPTATIATGTAVTFAEFAFTLTQADVATDITQVLLTMTGNASMSDLSYVRAYRDATANCNYDAGTDIQIGSDLSFTGSPPKATISIGAGLVQTNSSSQQACIHIRAATTANPTDQKTVKFGIMSSSDVTNSQSYPLSTSSGTPIEGQYSTIVNTNYSTWSGVTSGSWGTTTNWTSAIVPTSTRDCQIGVGTNATLVDANPVACANATLQTNGTLNYSATANVFEVYNTLDVSTGFNFTNATSGVITMKGSTNQTLKLATDFPGNVIINNSGISGSNTVSVGVNSVINGNLTCTGGVLSIPNAVTLTVKGNITIQTGCTITVLAGGILALGNNKTLTVDNGGILTLIGTAGSTSKITSDLNASAYNVIVNGTIQAQYYTFDHLNTAGVSIEAGATVDATYYMQNGTFSYPVNNTTTLLKLKRQIPGNTLSTMVFDPNGSAATPVTNIDTTGAGAGTLTISSYSGTLSGPANDVDPAYTISWSGASNTIEITQEATSPTTVTAGNTYTMGRYGFKQSQAGAYADTDVTTLALTLTGTGTASDVTSVKLYFDAACAGTGGTLIGTQTFSGNPAKATFTLGAGDLTVPFHAVTTVKKCAYVVFDIASNATNGNTVGVKINAAGDFVNSQTYAIAAGTAPPITLGTASTIDTPTTTTWTGTTSTAWTTASNWTAGVPDSTKSCSIPNVANDPIISAGTAVCKNVDITNGILTLNAGMNLEAYGDFTNTGTFTQSGNLYIKDGGVNINHTLRSSTTLANLTISKTGVGTVQVTDTNLIINSLSFTSNTINFYIPNGKKLILPNGFTLTQSTIRIDSGGTLEIGNGSTLTVAGGTLHISGTNDTFPQNAASKGKIAVQTAGTFTFTATSGNLDLVGFIFDKLDVNGLNIGGSTTLINLSGGQFTNLSTSYASVKAVQINTTGTIPSSATNIAWTWGAFNDFTATGGTPTSAQGYTLISSTGCASQTIDFTGWEGDWFSSQPTFDVTTKVSATSCTINMGAAASAVSLLSFTATPYNAEVDIRWTTNVERNHYGFNLYRTNADSTRFQQINRELIRNIVNSGSNQGKYRFIDQDLDNGTRYYYYLEDVDLTGKKTLHGPVYATPLGTLGAPPATAGDENSGTNPNGGNHGGGSSPSTIPNPSYRDLGNGTVILNQTSKSLRIEISPPAPTFAANTWNGVYDDVAITSYSKMTDAGKPELPEKEILIEVHRFAEIAQINSAAVTESAIGGHLIAPAPNYVLNGAGVLVPSYAPDATTYATSTDSPSAFYSIETTLINNQEKTFLRLKVTPLRYNPVTQVLRYASKIILNIGLDGDNWTITPPAGTSNIGPYAVANTLRINYEQKGLYQINYDDLVNSQVEGPFNAADTSLFRLYYNTREIPIEVNSTSGFFASGDNIRFYVPFTASLQDKKNQLILSRVNLTSDATAPLRITSLDSNPSGQSVSADIMTSYTKTFESNLMYVDGETLGDTEDHYFYARLINFTGLDTLSVSAPLDELDTSSSNNVQVKYHVRGMLGVLGTPIQHHVKFFIGASEEGEAIFSENTRQILTFEVPGDHFIAGNNTLNLQTIGTYAPAGDYDRVLVEKVEVTYRGQKYVVSGQSQFSIDDSLRSHIISNFNSNSIIGYDITYPYSTKKLSNVSVTTPDGGVTYDARFFVDDNVADDNNKYFLFTTTGAIFKPTSLSLNPGIYTSLKDGSNRADLIIIGHENLLAAVTDLVNQRKAQGLEVMTISYDQIYAEYSYGIAKSSAVRDMIDRALSSWVKAPRFLLILGDGTNDPLDHNIGALADSDRSVLSTETSPVPFMNGRFIDFAGDNYFVSSITSHLPRIAVGRLPTNDPDKIKTYVDKVISYEAGSKTPTTNLRQITFFADAEQGYYERFNQLSQNMIATVKGLSTTLYDRTIIGSDAGTTSKIIDEFTNAPLMISMIGHGAYDRYGNNLLSLANATALTNSKLPIVATWSCESAYFYDADKTYVSLSEELIFNPNGGAILFLGSTTQTTPPAQAKLAQNFFTRLSVMIDAPYDGTRAGEILNQAKLSVGSGNYEKDIINSFSIIGDPSLQLPTSLYPDRPGQAAVAAPAKKSVFSKLFGCSANANDNDQLDNPLPWYVGFIEFVVYLLLMVYSRRIIYYLKKKRE